MCYVVAYGECGGVTSKKSLKLWGKTQGKMVMVLVNSVASHNFMSHELWLKLRSNLILVWGWSQGPKEGSLSRLAIGIA